MRQVAPVFLAVALAACGDDDPQTTATEGVVTNLTGIVTMPGVTQATDPSTGDAATDPGPTGTDGLASDPAPTETNPHDPKFDLPPLPDAGGPTTDKGCTKVDLLFVIDSSGSMLDGQVTLVQSFPEFVTAMQTQLADTESYHVGVITSDAYPFNDPNCVQDGALVTRTGGDGASNMACQPFVGGKRWLSEADDLASKFGCVAQVGTSGDGNERPMYAMLQSVQPNLNGPGACNDGFIRQDALLVVVVITDEEDDHEVMACNQVAQPGSPGEPLDWYNGLVLAKGGVETNIAVLSLIGPTNPLCPMLDKCNGGIDGAEVSPRVEQFTKMFTYGSVGQICAPSYKQFFSDAIGVIDSACENFMPPA